MLQNKVDGIAEPRMNGTLSELLNLAGSLSGHRFDIEAVWQQALASLRQNLDAQIFAAWIEPLRIVHHELAISDDSSQKALVLDLITPNKFCCDHVKRTYGEQIVSTLAEIAGVQIVEVNYKVSESRPATLRRAPISGAASGQDASSSLQASSSNLDAEQVTNGVGPEHFEETDHVATGIRSSRRAVRKPALDFCNLNSKYNFSNFVIGQCNQFAHAASLRVAENPGGSYNPLFIYGGVGLGKTHLVNAIGNASRRRGKNALLISSEVFVNELISSLRSNRMQQFKERFRSLDLLVIDDIQFIIGKERTQEEFFHTFNALYQRRSQIVITSDKIPQELTGLEERLRTRFASGLSADLQAPDFETRVAILQKKSEGEEVALPDDVAQFLAEKIDTNVRELEGALNRLNALSAIHRIPVTLELAESALRTIVPDKTREVTIELIQKTVAERYNTSIKDLLGKRRTQNIVLPRQVAMHLCRKLTTCSYPEIGALFGGRDHSTVIHANRVIGDRTKEDRQLSEELDLLERRLRGR